MAVRLLERWLDRNARSDTLLESLPHRLPAVERARVQHLFYGVLREWSRLEGAAARYVSRAPRPVLRAVLLAVGYELLSEARTPGGVEAGKHAKIVHHAVEESKTLLAPPEVRLVNAVARRLAVHFAAAAAEQPAGPDAWPEHYSHPSWLVRRWRTHFGDEATERLLQWNQSAPPVHVRWRTPAEPPPAWLQPAPWDGFHVVGADAPWPEIEAMASAGRLYVQDPSTRIAPALLAPAPGSMVLDLCAAPGGKTLLLADRLGTGRITAVDLPGARLDRLQRNLETAPAGVTVTCLGADVLAPEGLPALLSAQGQPESYPAVLLDAPCSNTGVMRHRVDVKWRLREDDIARHGAQQLELVAAAAQCVAPSGRLVYGTCSLEPEENEHVIAAFLGSHAGEGWRMVERTLARPWETGHEGAGVFLLERTDGPSAARISG